jgi:hypothetical protein
MFAAARSRAARWLRIVFAVVALVATHAAVVRAAFGTACARAARSGSTAAIAGAAERGANGAAFHDAAIEAPHDPSTDTPEQGAVVPQCATGGTLVPIVDLPGGITVPDTVALPLASQTRPPSIAAPTPFRPPRAV